jgi:hypothetical protein
MLDTTIMTGRMASIPATSLLALSPFPKMDVACQNSFGIALN